MPYVVTCTFREPVKSYYLDPGDWELHIGSRVVAETARGLELGQVKFLPREVGEDKIVPPLRPVIRLATSEDIERHEQNRRMEEDLLPQIRECIARHRLPMRPIKCEMLLDRSKMIFFYESEERVDFRELLKDLSSRLGMRLHFQQVGPREASKVLGGVGVCGQPLCCATFLPAMPPVTLKMAKEQSLSLTPSRLSGACGRLKCCLRYEIEFYRDQNARLPGAGSPVDSPEGPGHVLSVNVITEECVIVLGDGRHLVVPGEALRTLREERGPVRACSNHIDQGGSCGGGSTGGGCGGNCGSNGSCGCGSKTGVSPKGRVAESYNSVSD
jgi:cell fate regulator YaaT (PSP1 superfamily)